MVPSFLKSMNDPLMWLQIKFERGTVYPANIHDPTYFPPQPAFLHLPPPLCNRLPAICSSYAHHPRA